MLRPGSFSTALRGWGLATEHPTLSSVRNPGEWTETTGVQLELSMISPQLENPAGYDLAFSVGVQKWRFLPRSIGKDRVVGGIVVGGVVAECAQSSASSRGRALPDGLMNGRCRKEGHLQDFRQSIRCCRPRVGAREGGAVVSQPRTWPRDTKNA